MLIDRQHELSRKTADLMPRTDPEIVTLLSRLTVELETIMQSIKVRSHVGSDGILHLDVPVGIHDVDLEVIVTVQSVTALKVKTPEELGYPADFFEKTAGSFEDEPLIRYPQGEMQARLWDELE
jgi:hypothetical protein